MHVDTDGGGRSTACKKAGDKDDPGRFQANLIVPGFLAAGLQVFVDGFLAAHEFGHFRPHLFHGGLFPQLFVLKLVDNQDRKSVV